MYYVVASLSRVNRRCGSERKIRSKLRSPSFPARKLESKGKTRSIAAHCYQKKTPKNIILWVSVAARSAVQGSASVGLELLTSRLGLPHSQEKTRPSCSSIQTIRNGLGSDHMLCHPFARGIAGQRISPLSRSTVSFLSTDQRLGIPTTAARQPRPETLSVGKILKAALTLSRLLNLKPFASKPTHTAEAPNASRYCGKPASHNSQRWACSAATGRRWAQCVWHWDGRELCIRALGLGQRLVFSAHGRTVQ